MIQISIHKDKNLKKIGFFYKAKNVFCSHTSTAPDRAPSLIIIQFSL